jgi:hypothetical protein
MNDLITIVKPKRSTFLTVLCVLTFIGSGFGIVKQTLAYKDAAEVSKMGKASIDKNRATGASAKNARANKFIEAALDMLDEKKIKQQAIGLFIASLLTLSGAVLMFLMKPFGFWFYLAGSIINVAVPLYLFGWNTIPGIIAVVVPGIIGTAFVVMYAFNLKDMRPQEMEDGLL